MAETARATLSRPIALALAVAALEPVAVPAEAQQRPTRSTSRETTRQSPLQYAVSLKRAGRSAGQAAVAPTRRHRLKSDAVASTLPAPATSRRRWGGPWSTGSG